MESVLHWACKSEKDNEVLVELLLPKFIKWDILYCLPNMRVSAFQMHLTIECPTLVYIDSMSWNIILLLELTWSDLQNNQQCRYSRAIVIRFGVVRLVVRAQECYTLGGRVSHECHSAVGSACARMLYPRRQSFTWMPFCTLSSYTNVHLPPLPQSCPPPLPPWNLWALHELWEQV